MQANDVRLLRAAVIPTAILGLIAVVVAAIVVGGQGALAAAIGLGVVVVFFTVGLIAVAYASRISPTMMMAAALGGFFTKILLLAVLLSAFRDATVWDPMSFTLTVVACTICWTFAEARAFSKLRVFYVEPDVKVPGHIEEKKR